jgi:hypothetical protein
MKKILFAAVLLAASAVNAATVYHEADKLCELERAQTEVAATLAASPSAFASVGDPTASTKTAVIGVRQSFAGIRSAKFMREAVDARCMYIRAAAVLNTHVRWALVDAQQSAAQVELSHVDAAIALADTNVKQLEQQLEVNAVTITQVNDARSQLIMLETRKLELRKITELTTDPAPAGNLVNLVAEANNSQAEYTRLEVLAKTESAWDVGISAGVRRQYGSGAVNSGGKGFASVYISYSFGAGSSAAAADRVRTAARDYQEAREAGFTRTLAREAEDVANLLDIEKAQRATLTGRISSLKKFVASISSLDTAVANSEKRGASIQLEILNAQLFGAERRVSGYQAILAQLK